MRQPAAGLDLPDISVGEAGGVPTLYLPSNSTTHHVMLAFRVGRADEQLASAGVTHLVEHLAFPASATGVTRSNGWVGDTMTAFVTRGSESEARGFVSDTCAALAAPPVERLEHEKRVIATEQSSQGMFPPWGMLPLRVGATAWGTLGFEQFGLERLSAVDLQVWAGYWFTRGNAVICHNGPEPIDFDVDPLPHGFRRPLPERTLVADLELPSFSPSGWPTVVVSMECERRPGCGTALRVLRTAAEQRLRHGLGLSYSVGEFLTGGGDGKALCFLFADALPEHAGDVANGLWEMLTRFAEGGPTRMELEHELDLTRQMFQDSEAHAALLPYLAGEFLTGSSVDDALRAVQAPLQLEPHEVQDFARELRATALFTGPRESEPSDAVLHPYPYVSDRPIAGQPLRKRGFEVPGELILGADGIALELGEGAAVNAHFSACEVVLRWRNGDLVVITSNADRIWVLNRHYHDVASVEAAIVRAVPADRIVDYPDPECPTGPSLQSGLRPAPLRARVLAGVVDLLIVFMILVGAIAATQAVLHLFTGWEPEGPHESTFEWVEFGLWAVATWLYFALFESLRGATPGKDSKQLVVVDASGERLSFLRASVRFATATVGIAGVGIGVIMILCSRKRHGLHDLVTRTDVMQRPFSH